MTEQLLFKKVVDMSVLNQCIRNVSITKIVSDIEQEINTRGTKIAQAFN